MYIYYRLEREGDIKGALRCYREALADNPQAEPAKTRSAILTTALEKKVCHINHVTWCHVMYYHLSPSLYTLSMGTSSSTDSLSLDNELH